MGSTPSTTSSSGPSPSGCGWRGCWSTRRTASATGGGFDNGLGFTLTMGAGTWAGNSISDNLSYRHFLNITRLARLIPPREPDRATQLFGHYLRDLRTVNRGSPRIPRKKPARRRRGPATPDGAVASDGGRSRHDRGRPRRAASSSRPRYLPASAASPAPSSFADDPAQAQQAAGQSLLGIADQRVHGERGARRDRLCHRPRAVRRRARRPGRKGPARPVLGRGRDGHRGGQRQRAREGAAAADRHPNAGSRTPAPRAARAAPT